MNKSVYNQTGHNIELKEKEVHIWNFNTKSISEGKKILLRSTLSLDEVERAGRFHFDRDRDVFICGAGILRLLIQLYTNIPSKKVSFDYNKFGKPEISKGQNNSDLYFNLSNSQDNICIGFILNDSIGVDIEVVKPINDFLDVANNFFSEPEIEQLQSFEGENKLEAFYTCWTSKESFIKFSGEGLSYPLKEFVVQIGKLEIDETFQYYLKTNNTNENFFVESFRLSEEMFGAFTLKDQPEKTTYWIFNEKNYSINNLIEQNIKG